MVPAESTSASTPWWSQAELNAFVHRAIENGLGDSSRRDLLLFGLPQHVRASLPVKERPADQLRSDVHHLAALPGAPLRIWLENATQICRPGTFAHAPGPSGARTSAPGQPLTERPSVRVRTLLVLVAILAFAGLTWALVRHFSAEVEARNQARATQLQLRARLLHKEMKFRQAFASFKEALGLTPADARLRAEAGWAAFKAGLLVEADQLLVSAYADVGRGELAAMITYNLGRPREVQGRPREAAALYEASLADREHAVVRKRLDGLRGSRD
jgi:tetratricopeptide (TPR) repeat protein